MAIYHLSVKIIGRSHGKSAVAAAAYRSASELHDQRQGLAFDYTKKLGVIHSEILAPVLAPEWIFDREKLWNAVEAIETRINSQVAREIEIAIPKELNKTQAISVTKEFVDKQFVAKGMVADLNIHWDNLENPHAHILLTTREIRRSGFGEKNRTWNQKERVLEWRQAWAETVNAHLKAAGYEVAIDHRSYEDQGLEIEPTIHLGSRVNYSGAQGYTLRQEYNAIVRRNFERIVENPKVALDLLTKQQAVFTEIDLAKFAHRNSNTKEEYQEVIEAIKSSPLLLELAKTEQGRTIYTAREMAEVEVGLMEAAADLKRSKGHHVSEKHQKQALHGTWLEKMVGKERLKLGDEQMQGLEHLLENGDIKVLVGYAGTGKSTLMNIAKDAWVAEGYRVLGTAPSGIAAQNLEEIGIASRTIDSLLLAIDKEKFSLTSNDVLIIDEAGMIDSRRMYELLLTAEAAEAKVVLVGDTEQLQSIQAGAPFRAIANKVGYVEVTEILRQYDPESPERTQRMREASRNFATLKTANALEIYQNMGSIHQHATHDEALNAVTAAWDKGRDQGGSQIMLAYTRNDVNDLNAQARELLKGELQQEYSLLVKNREGEPQVKPFAVNERIYFIKNDKDLGVKNGSLGTILEIKGNNLSVVLDNGTTVAFDLEEYNSITHGYAATIHKAQSITVDRTYVVADQHLDRHVTYVAATRHRRHLEIHYDKNNFRSIYNLYGIASREKIKDMASDYAELRDLQPVQEYLQEERERTIEIDKRLAVSLEEYLDKQIELSKEQLVNFRQGTDQHSAKEHRQKLHALAKELIQSAQKVMAHPKAQEFSKNTKYSATSTSFDAGKLKEKIHDQRLSGAEFSSLIKEVNAATHANGVFAAIEQHLQKELSQEQDEGISW